MHRLVAITLAILSFSSTALAQQAPTTAHALRPLATDRPDVTESPRSLDAGHVLLELELASVHLDYDGRHVGTDLVELNARIGLFSFADFQVVVSTWSDRIARDGSHTSSVARTRLRLKLNLIGNDGGPVAVGLLPILTLPTPYGDPDADRVEGGLAVPFSFALPAGFELGAMIEADVRHETGGAYHAAFLSTLSLSIPIVGPLSAFVELANDTCFAPTVQAFGHLDAGLLALLGEDVQLDLGTNLRIWGPPGDDVRLFVGLAIRR